MINSTFFFEILKLFSRIILNLEHIHTYFQEKNECFWSNSDMCHRSKSVGKLDDLTIHSLESNVNNSFFDKSLNSPIFCDHKIHSVHTNIPRESSSSDEITFAGALSLYFL